MLEPTDPIAVLVAVISSMGAAVTLLARSARHAA
jgi:hypothetical protein